MNIALIGATGFIGSKILNEALQRGHRVTALVRNTEKLPRHQNLIPHKSDIFNAVEFINAIKGHDAVVSAYNPGWGDPEMYKTQVAGALSIIDGVKQSGVKRLLVVGGGGSLEIAPGVQLVDTPQFPKEWKDGALAMREFLLMLRSEQELEWTFFSPPMFIEPGERTGTFRLGGDQMVFNSKGESKISVEDYAVAMIDELEQPKHIRKRFTIAY